MDVLITRHGQTEWNVLKKIQGKVDIELNETGIDQARITADSLINEEIDLIISSPLKRALQTAQIINENKNVPIIIDDRISERNFGEYEGVETTSFDFNSLWNYKNDIKYGSAESMKELFDRVYEFLDELKIKYKDKKVLLVTHGGISIPMQCYFNGIPDTECLFPLCIRNCEVIKFENV